MQCSGMSGEGATGNAAVAAQGPAPTHAASPELLVRPPPALQGGSREGRHPLVQGTGSRKCPYGVTAFFFSISFTTSCSLLTACSPHWGSRNQPAVRACRRPAELILTPASCWLHGSQFRLHKGEWSPAPPPLPTKNFLTIKNSHLHD